MIQHTTTDTEPRSERSLAGRTCVVTGASRGIGREIATDLGSHGAVVIVNYRSSRDAALDVAQEIDDAAGEAKVLQADVSDFEAVSAMADRVHDAFGPIDILINNAGITADRSFADMTLEDWHRVLDVNLSGAFNATKAFYDDLITTDHGRLIGVSSVVGRRGNYGQVNYAASKAGLIGFTRAIARELAPHGTTANCVAPGFTQTDMVERVPDHVQDRIRDSIPMSRFASAAEIAAAVRYLASEEAGFVTGEVIDVNGGMHI